MRMGIHQPRQNLKEGERYEYPPFHNFFESGDTYLPVNWNTEGQSIVGYFNSPEYEYKTIISPFVYPYPLSSDNTYNCANVSFETKVDGKWTTEITPTKYSFQVMSTIQNSLGEKVIDFELDAIIMVATNSVDSRMKLYNHLADRYTNKFGKVYKNLKTNNIVSEDYLMICHF